jgi:hypothetical protein
MKETNLTDFLCTDNYGMKSRIGGRIRELMTSGYVMFKPTSNGCRNAPLEIVSMEPDENPFLLDLVGVG